MTTKQELLDKIAELQTKVDAMSDDKPKRPRGMPALKSEVKEGQIVFIASTVDFLTFDYRYEHSLSCYIDMGLIFLTKEDCQIHIDRQKVMQELRELARVWDIDWSDGGQFKYYPCYDHCDESWYVSSTRYMQETLLPHFPTEEAAENAIDTIGQERLSVLL